MKDGGLTLIRVDGRWRGDQPCRSSPRLRTACHQQASVRPGSCFGDDDGLSRRGVTEHCVCLPCAGDDRDEAGYGGIAVHPGCRSRWSYRGCAPCTWHPNRGLQSLFQSTCEEEISQINHDRIFSYQPRRATRRSRLAVSAFPSDS